MLWPLGKSSTPDIQLNHLCWPVPVSMSSTERWHMGRGRQPAPQMAPLHLYKSAQCHINRILCDVGQRCLCGFCNSPNRTILIRQALSVSLQTMKLPQLPLFDCYICEMGSKLGHSLLSFTQRARLITNDNSEISEGCLTKMVGSFDRLLWRVGLQWQSIQSEHCSDE